MVQLQLGSQFRDTGYLPQAMVNYLALLGWGDGTEDEFFTLEQLGKFTIERVNKSGKWFWRCPQSQFMAPKMLLFFPQSEKILQRSPRRSMSKLLRQRISQLEERLPFMRLPPT